MKNNILIAILLLAIMNFLSCREDDSLDDSTLKCPISGLIFTVNGTDYVAVPKLTESGTLSNTLLLEVKIPASSALVKQITLLNSQSTINIKQGDAVTFIDNRLSLVLKTGSESYTYEVEMSFSPPPFLYFIKSSDKDGQGNRNFLDKKNSQTIASGGYNESYEGYIDLSKTNWDNIGLITSDLATYYDVDGGWSPAKSYGTFVLQKKSSPGTGYYPVQGPWADWKWTNGNAFVISPGIWKLNFNTTTSALNLLATQWAIVGTAVGKVEPMSYSSDTGIWTLTTDLSAGKFKFTTIPISAGDPVIVYGDSEGIAKLSETGTDISITEPGRYTIGLNLNKPPYYNYTITLNK